MHVTTTRKSENIVEIHIYGSLGNPLVTAPSICCTADWDIALTLEKTPSATNWSISGEHDGFPAYEVYIGKQRIYTYDPGKAPYDFLKQISRLGTPMDVTMKLRSGTMAK
jgi:hypothetical protein